MIGATLGRYQILEPLGRGGMGEVFLAEDPVLGRKLAIKVLPREFALDPERRARLLHEARAASALNHPNIITVHDLGESDGTLFVAVELVDGVTLREWAAAKQRPPADSLHLARQAAQALALAHSAGLVHRDLKPENLMVRRDGLLKILDFGLARSLTPGGTGQTATMPGTVMGTAPYMSPEQVLGQPAGPSSDIFSLGTILYELLTGKHPFAVDSPVETMHRILHETPELPSRVNPALNAEFDFVLGKALSKDPRRRQPSMSDLDVDLETLECGCGPIAGAAELDAKPGVPRTIAVLPFKNIGGDPALNYLGVGLADAVITRLSHSPDLIVRTTSSILPYENKPVDPRRVGQEMDSTAVLDASFQRAGDRFRVTARLVESATGRPLWAGKVDVRCEDIFDVQDQVAHGIAEALTARLTTVAEAPKSAHVPSSLAYEHVLRGLEGLRRGSLEGIQFAIGELEAAVRVEPGYGQAWAHLGFAYHGMTDAGFSGDPVWYEKAGQALTRARALDPENGQVHFATGSLYVVLGRKREAYRELSTAVALMPNSASSYHYLGYTYRLCDMLPESRSAFERSIELDPYAPWSYRALARLEALHGRQVEARRWIEREHEKLQGAPLRGLERFILIMEGRYADALALAASRRGAADLLESELIHHALLEHLAGNPARAAECFEKGRAIAEIDMDWAASAAMYLAQVGDLDGAFRSLARATELGNDMLAMYEQIRFYEPLRGDPRWGPFIEGVRRRVAEYKREFRWPPAAA